MTVKQVYIKRLTRELDKRGNYYTGNMDNMTLKQVSDMYDLFILATWTEFVAYAVKFGIVIK